jgi:hypothetical protein
LVISGAEWGGVNAGPGLRSASSLEVGFKYLVANQKGWVPQSALMVELSTPAGYGLPWSSFESEAQATLVEQWFGGIPTVEAPNRHEGLLPPDPADPYFSYLQNNIRRGQT